MVSATFFANSSPAIAKADSLAFLFQSITLLSGQITKTMTRQQISPAPQPPFPLTAHNIPIISGFGRGSSELGIPTANVPVDSISEELMKLDVGVYFGYAVIHRDTAHTEPKVLYRGKNGVVSTSSKCTEGEELEAVTYKYGLTLKDSEVGVVLPQVMSIGFNPFYGNDTKTIELHLIHEFSDTFYGANVSFNVLGYIRPELDYVSKEALIRDIERDIEAGLEALERDEYKVYKDL